MKSFKSGLAVSVLGLIFTFQNCSKIGFTQGGQTEAIASQTENSSLNLLTNSNGSKTNAGHIDAFESQYCDDVAIPKYEVFSYAKSDQVVQHYNGPVNIESVGRVSLNAISGPIHINNIYELVQAQFLFGTYDGNPEHWNPSEIHALQIDSISNFRGAMILRANSIYRIENGNGNLSLASFDLSHLSGFSGPVCLTVKMAKVIEQIGGDLKISGPKGEARAEVDLVSDTTGTLKLVNVHLKLLKGHHGAVQLVNSVIDVQEGVSPL